ncbi:hypothetical protein [Streptomyces sp. NPDC051219]|uniref:hypothetical protein n=1 Tax=Streptomyces sp. NPDC051219 TaxID=3155283 RepID=UPI003419BCDC
MSAQPHESPVAAYADPHRLEAGEGPQTLAELRAALAVIDPTELTAFNARLDAARFGAEQAAIIAEARHLVALRTRTEVQAAITAMITGTTEVAPVADLYAYLEGKGSAA